MAPLYSTLEDLPKNTLPPSATPFVASEETVSTPVTHPVTQKVTQSSPHKATHKTTRLSKGVSRHLLNQPTAEEIEDLHYRLRKVNKVRVNADVPMEWKDRLNDLAHELGVGKYELMLYVIGTFLGEAQSPQDPD